MMTRLAAAAALLMSAPAAAEVVSSGEHGFELSYSLVVSAEPAGAVSAFAQPARWWNKDHTYSGSAANLSLELEPGGCFCEKLPQGGGIEHLRVAYVDPGKRVVLTGSLGPLLYEATSGVMDLQFKPRTGGSQVVISYRVSGFAKGGAAKWAPLVDRVLADQFDRYRAYAAAPAPAR